MKERISKLLTIKSIVTLLITILFGALAIKGEISGDKVVMVYVSIIGFYFGTQSEKDVKNR